MRRFPENVDLIGVLDQAAIASNLQFVRASNFWRGKLCISLKIISWMCQGFNETLFYNNQLGCDYKVYFLENVDLKKLKFQRLAHCIKNLGKLHKTPLLLPAK